MMELVNLFLWAFVGVTMFYSISVAGFEAARSES